MRSLTTGVLNALVAGGSFVPMYTPGRAERMAAKFDYDGFEYNGGQELYELETCAECKTGGHCERESCFGTFASYPDTYAGRLMKRIVGTPDLGPWQAGDYASMPTVERLAANPWWTLPPAECGYKVLFLIREYEEARQSAAAMISADGTTRAVFPFANRAHYNAIVYGALTDALAKADVSVVASRYMADDPLREFSLLRERGWPIDPAKCADVIDRDKFHYRVEELERGIPVAV